MTADKAPRRWWCGTNHVELNFYRCKCFDCTSSWISGDDYDALKAELEREKKKVEKLKEIRRHHAWHNEDCLCESSYDDRDCDCGFDKRLAELEALDKESEGDE